VKRTKMFVSVIGLSAGLMLLSGCGPTTGIDAVVSQVNAHLQQAATFEQQVQPIATRLETVPYSKTGAGKAIDLTRQAQSALASETAELAAARQALATIASLPVKAEFKKYAGLEIKALDTRIAIVADSAKIYAQKAQAYNAVRKKTFTTTGLTAVETSIDSLTSQITSLTAQAAAQSKAAADYFSANGLGQ
jgi:hypothetical protein